MILLFILPWMEESREGKQSFCHAVYADVLKGIKEFHKEYLS